MRILALVMLLLLSLKLAQADQPSTQPAAFSTAKPGAGLPESWVLETLPNVPRPTRFDLVSDQNQTVLRALSEGAAATVVHPLAINPEQTPWLSWRWKVSRALDSADLATKAGDDYAARVYVLFDYPADRLPLADRIKIALVRAVYGQALPAAALCYVWDNRHPVGTSAWSPYTGRVRMIVADSGNGQAGRWQAVRRNVAADFKAAFGEEPPPVSGIALAADTDNTGETVTAWFGDLIFLPRLEENKQSQP